MFFRGGEFFFSLTVWRYQWECLQICCGKTSKFYHHISGSRVIHIVIVFCLRPPSVWHLSFISKSSQNWRQDLFQKWKLYRRTRTPSWLLSISGVIQILMRVIRLTNGKPCRCYNTCGYMIFMTWVISLNNVTVMW